MIILVFIKHFVMLILPISIKTTKQKELYKTAHEFLYTKSSKRTELCYLKNYDERDSIAKEYYEICHQLDVEQNIQQEKYFCRMVVSQLYKNRQSMKI